MNTKKPRNIRGIPDETHLKVKAYCALHEGLVGEFYARAAEAELRRQENKQV